MPLFIHFVKWFLYHCSQVKPDQITMRKKYISTQSNELLSYFNEQDRICFGYAEAFKALPAFNGMEYLKDKGEW